MDVMTTKLPDLPRVFALDGNTFESVIHAMAVYETSKRKKWQVSLRYLLSLFNRSSLTSVSRPLRSAVEKGFVKIYKKSRGALPNVYVRGNFFADNPYQGELLIRLANSLFGKKQGLLHNWPPPAAWGHGSLGAPAVLCLAVLRKSQNPMAKAALKTYLSPLVSKSSFDRAINLLKEHRLIAEKNKTIALAPNWDLTLTRYLEEHPACNERKRKGDTRRRQESERNRQRVAKGSLTDAERQELKTLRCVRKGCRNKATELEHWPPNRYLKGLADRRNRHLVWAICQKHNKETCNFIRSLGPITPERGKEVSVRSGTEPYLLYRVNANHWYRKFIRAFQAKNRAAARAAISNTLGLWHIIKNSSPPSSIDKRPSQRLQRGATSGRRHSTWDSQLT